ncbi:hypothetical protein [Natrinema pallidum]|uniref:Uncharacterized protein n=1 Tax=Natrinema pallidum DSM 3751 TaxID=1227495 RepID=L9YYG5_9EURY|nr:hypothetical protein [Natrinema pallidum]ELY79310.1 hypothetical protein C487_06363 [Natrinema pallidum DSM 3751]
MRSVSIGAGRPFEPECRTGTGTSGRCDREVVIVGDGGLDLEGDPRIGGGEAIEADLNRVVRRRYSQRKLKDQF